MNLNKLLETVKTNNPSEPDTYQRKQTALINNQFHDYDVVEFCNQRNILVMDLRLVSRLWQFPKEVLEEAWNESISSPLDLYQEALKLTKKSGEMQDYDSEEVKEYKDSISDVMLDTLEKNRKLVKANISYLQELGVQNVKEIFHQYYEMFLMDYSNFESIFNPYDREDLVEKLAKNVEIMEYL